MTRPLRVAELCAGYSGLTLGLAMASLDIELAWYAENDPDASTVMAAHHPGIPNVGDITTTDWTRAEPVDILAAGFPCQPFSVAGRRKGTADERWIWPAVADAIRDLRPGIVLLENVPGLLVGGGMGRVVGDLAAIRYDARWVCVRASDVGAAHQRKRVFIVASPADSDSLAVRPELVGVGVRQYPAVAGDDREGLAGLALLPTPAAKLGDGRGLASVGVATARWDYGRRDLDDAIALLPTPRASDGTKGGPNQRGSSGDLMLPSAVQPERWGAYRAAISRWEMVIGRPAPAPTETGQRGAQRLSARFVEWLVGLDAGHVTEHVGRSAALRILGNGVVPQQAAHAIRLLASTPVAGRWVA